LPYEYNYIKGDRERSPHMLNYQMIGWHILHIRLTRSLRLCGISDTMELIEGKPAVSQNRRDQVAEGCLNVADAAGISKEVVYIYPFNM
jgi:hypothetical protein